MIARRVLATLFCCALTTTAFAQSAPNSVDEARSGWRQRRTVTVKDAASLSALALPPEVLSKSAADLRDVRLLRDGSGQEVPYIVEELSPIREDRYARGELVDTRVERRESTTWLVELKRARSFTSLSLRIDDSEFVKRLKVEAATSRDGPYRVIADDVWAKLLSARSASACSCAS